MKIEIGDNLKEVMCDVISKSIYSKVGEQFQEAFGFNMNELIKVELLKEEKKDERIEIERNREEDKES